MHYEENQGKIPSSLHKRGTYNLISTSRVSSQMLI